MPYIIDSSFAEPDGKRYKRSYESGSQRHVESGYPAESNGRYRKDPCRNSLAMHIPPGKLADLITVRIQFPVIIRLKPRI